jgi:hypothetical protein
MPRFQALTNSVLDAELEMVRTRLGLSPSQKADLLREVTALAAWVVRQAEQGRDIQARRGDDVEPLSHPAIDRLRAATEQPIGATLALSDTEVQRLADVLERGFDPPPALRKALANLASDKRRPPKLRWKKKAGAR